MVFFLGKIAKGWFGYCSHQMVGTSWGFVQLPLIKQQLTLI